MTESTKCQSCTMPIESGRLCPHCGDEHGTLRPFDEIFPRMVQWSLRNESGLSREQAEAQTLRFMSSMPAWRDHPEVKARLGAAG
ncbi:MAG: hypothetical protein AAF628_15640 [Planctomycetota bacterium]